MEIKRLCVFCGSSPGDRPEYAAAARELGRILLENRIGLVYGGGCVGLMYEVARTVHEGGGEVVGVIPRGMVEQELAYQDLDDLRVVSSMHERKALMAELAGGFVALPGGLGTLEEIFEALTWAQLGMHPKPCGLLNVLGYYDKLLEFLDRGVQDKFLQMEHRNMILVDKNPGSLVAKFRDYAPPSADMARWVLDIKEGNGKE
jgi:uncharacterized protein (TIGR00730 family)